MRGFTRAIGGVAVIFLPGAAGIVFGGGAACAGRASEHSDAGKLIAEHLCPVQADCGCPDEHLIQDCEARVERHFAEKEREAVEIGLTFDAGCLQAFLDQIDEAGTCASQQYSIPQDERPPPCPVYGGDRGVDEACEVREYLPLITDCRAGLTCSEGVCRDFVNLPTLMEGELCSESGIDSTLPLGVCAGGLQCDPDSRTCVATPIPLPTGSVCTATAACGPAGYCRTESPEDFPSEDSPGRCQPRTTMPGEPCEYANECEMFFCAQACGSADTFCVENTCLVPPPALCRLLSDWFAEEDGAAGQ